MKKHESIEDELLDKFTVKVNGLDSNGDKQVVYEMVLKENVKQFAVQYHQSKLEELDRWIDDNKFSTSKEEDYVKFVYVPELKSKIKSL